MATNRVNAVSSACGPSLYRWTGGGGPHSWTGSGGRSPFGTRACKGRTLRRARLTKRVGAPGASGARRGPPAPREPALAEVLGELHLLGRGTALVRPRRLHHARQPVEARLGEEHGAAVGAELALGDVRVAVAVGPERRLAVVEVQRADALDADELDALVEHAAERLGRADLEARSEEVAGVEADPQALVAARGVDERG